MESGTTSQINRAGSIVRQLNSAKQYSDSFMNVLEPAVGRLNFTAFVVRPNLKIVSAQEVFGCLPIDKENPFELSDSTQPK